MQHFNLSLGIYRFQLRRRFGQDFLSFRSLNWKELADACRTSRFPAGGGLHADIRISQVRPVLRRQSSHPKLLMYGSVPLHGIRAVDLS